MFLESVSYFVHPKISRCAKPQVPSLEQSLEGLGELAILDAFSSEGVD